MRFWELDFSRGIAIILMVIFNWAFALSYFHILFFESWLFWFVFPRLIAGMFVLVAGISFSVSYSRLEKTGNIKIKKIYRKYWKRGAKLFGLGLLATLATWIFFPQGTIIFGILHFLGISVMIAPFFQKAERWLLPLGILIIISGIILQNITFDFSWLLWLGLAPHFYTFDYFPLIPWFGLFLLGIYFGNHLYSKEKRNFKIKGQPKILGPIGFLGRHSLIIYVLHQPVLMAIIYAMGYSLF